MWHSKGIEFARGSRKAFLGYHWDEEVHQERTFCQSRADLSASDIARMYNRVVHDNNPQNESETIELVTPKRPYRLRNPKPGMFGSTVCLLLYPLPPIATSRANTVEK